MTDEAHFDLSAYVNKQNFRICGSENPRFIVEKPLHPQGSLDLTFFLNEEEASVTLNVLY